MVILGLGSNLLSSFGDRFQNIDRAIFLLNRLGVQIIKKSSYYETPSYPAATNPKFINVIVQAKLSLNPKQLASVIIDVENKLERKRSKKNAPRTCDIDIIDFNSKAFDFEYNGLSFTVPHERLSIRNFVLFPLNEILPNWRHPVSDDVVVELIEKLSSDEKNSILKVEKP